MLYAKPLHFVNENSKLFRMASTASGIKSTVSDVIKSAQDTRLYRGLVLDNDMKIMLVSDPATDKAAAALDVNVGKLSAEDLTI